MAATIRAAHTPWRAQLPGRSAGWAGRKWQRARGLERLVAASGGRPSDRRAVDRSPRSIERPPGRAVRLAAANRLRIRRCPPAARLDPGRACHDRVRRRAGGGRRLGCNAGARWRRLRCATEVGGAAVGVQPRGRDLSRMGPRSPSGQNPIRTSTGTSPWRPRPGHRVAASPRQPRSLRLAVIASPTAAKQVARVQRHSHPTAAASSRGSRNQTATRPSVVSSWSLPSRPDAWRSTPRRAQQKAAPHDLLGAGERPSRRGNRRRRGHDDRFLRRAPKKHWPSHVDEGVRATVCVVGLLATHHGLAVDRLCVR